MTTTVITTQAAQSLISTIIGNPAVGFIEIAALAGLRLYVIIGVIAIGLSAQFYHHLEVRLGKKYGMVSIANSLAWAHLVLMNIGIAAASSIMIYAGYIGDIAVTSEEERLLFGLGSGWGWTIQQASEQILNPLIVPAGIMLLIAAIGAVCGGIGFILVYFRKDENLKTRREK